MELPTLNYYEAAMFAHFDIVAPPGATVPYGWRISYAGVPVAPIPGRFEMQRVITSRRSRMPDWKRALPRYAPDSPYWPALLKKERKAEIGNRIVHGRVVHPDLRNREGRERFWSVPGRTIYTVIAAARRAEIVREANNAEIVEIPSEEEEEEPIEEESGSGSSEIVD